MSDAFYPKNRNDRFWSKVDVRGPDDCWEWKAFKNKGYGIFRFLDQKVVASRWAWEIANRANLGDRLACHKCDNPGCCNPAHIYAGTPKSNAQDASERGRLRAGIGAGETHPSAKLTFGDVARIRKMMAAGQRISDLADAYGVSRASIYKIKNGTTWNERGV